jgi:hypothetical protein
MEALLNVGIDFPLSPALLPKEKEARNLLFPLPRERVRVRANSTFIPKFSNTGIGVFLDRC